jgi:hypothetical protein
LHVPDRWKEIKYFWLDHRNLDASNIVNGQFHWCRCKLFAADEFPE